MSAKVTDEHLLAAIDVVDAWRKESGGLDLMYPVTMERGIALALADAEQAEREACAQIAEYDFRLEGGWEGPVAKAIRARGTPAKEKADG